MRYYSIFFAALLLSSATLVAQSTSETATKHFSLQQTILPPDLKVVNGSLRFQDADGNNIINANEASSIRFQVKNMGRGTAYDCVALIRATGSTDGLEYTRHKLDPILAGEERNIVFPIQATEYTTDGTVQFSLAVDEPSGFGTEPVQLTVKTKKLVAPWVEIVSYKLFSDGDTQLHKKKAFRLQVLVQNTDQGVARNVGIALRLPENIYLLDGNQTELLPVLRPNQSELIEYELQSNGSVLDDIALSFQLSESYGRFAENGEIPLHFGQALQSGMTAMHVEGRDGERVEIIRESLTSDVDENIPFSKAKNTHTYAVIIANENYFNVSTVPFALNDGNIFRKYCQQTLGLPSDNIRYVPNATLNQINHELTWLKNIVDADPDAKVIFYYAGHGIPDEADRTSYLLPVDGVGTDVTTGYRLDELYTALGALHSSSVTVFMDACFSGSKRDNGMLASARGVALKAKAGAPQGNMVVFSAAQGSETAFPYRAKQHGMFTYYLLKHLQQTSGNTTYADLSDYISRNVRISAVQVNDKPQTPTTTASPALGDTWKAWKLK